MADTSSPFGNVADLWGEPVALRAQRQAHDLAAQTTAQTQSREATARADLANVWNEHQGNLKAFLLDPRFMSNPLADSKLNMLKLIQELQQGPAPIAMGADAKLVSPNQMDPETGQLRTLATNPKAPESSFVKHADTKAVDRFSKLAEDGDAARNEGQSLAALRTALGTAPEAGALTTIRAMASEKFGIDLGGKTDIEVVGSLIDRLSPRQRVPGSGSSSDKDVQLMKASLPSLLLSKAGRETVLRNLETMTNERIRVGDVADEVLFGSLDKQEAMRRIRGSRPDSAKSPTSPTSYQSLSNDALLGAFEAATDPQVRAAIQVEAKRRKGKR